MPSTGTMALGSATVLVLLVGASAGTGALDVTGQLERALNGTVDSALRDMAVGWLDVTDAQGWTENGTVSEADLLVRMDGTSTHIDLEALVVERADQRSIDPSVVSVLRDQDGSIDDGVINEDDLVRLRFELEPALQPDASVTVTFHDPGKAPLKLTLTAPRNLGENPVTLDTRTDW